VVLWWFLTRLAVVAIARHGGDDLRLGVGRLFRAGQLPLKNTFAAWIERLY
jgi:hypothetical protein